MDAQTPGQIWGDIFNMSVSSIGLWFSASEAGLESASFECNNYNLWRLGEQQILKEPYLSKPVQSGKFSSESF